MSEKLAGQNLVPKIEIEAEVKMSDISLHLAEEINQLAPFGQNNQQPKLVSYNLTIEDIAFMGFENQHIKIRVAGFWAIAFGLAEQYKQFQVGVQVDLVYYLEINDFNGRREAQLKIIDLKFSK